MFMQGFHVTVERGVLCRMRDGTRLVADIYRPDTREPVPVLLMRQPYGRALASTVTYAHPSWYARQGYLVVIQDVRGRGGSEGRFDPFVQEVDDGYDTVKWAADLPGSNGRVGMYGFSYQGTAQWAALAGRPPHLAAIAPAMCAADLYHGWFYREGRFALTELGWAYQLARDTAQRQGRADLAEALTRAMKAPDYTHLPLTDQPLLEAADAGFWQEWVSHPAYDGYWKRRNWLPAALDHPVPTFHIGGWFDPYLAGTLQSYVALAEQDPGRHTLIIGPWGHIPWGAKTAHYDAGPAGQINLDLLMVRFFDYWLKGDQSAVWGSPVQFYALNSRSWFHHDRWPPKTTPRRWFLTGQGRANGASGDGTLNPQPSDAPPDVYVYDSRLPMGLDGYAPADRSVVQERQEILVYTSPPLPRGLMVAGSPTLTVPAQVFDGPTDLTAIVTVVTPEGAARFLSVGRTTVAPTPDEVISSRSLTLRPLAVRIAPGDRIRLELTSSAFPLLARHPNGTDDAGVFGATALDLRMATVTVWHDRDHPAWLDLPVIFEEEPNAE